jgi:23S rRNA (uridine2552-2'-O)-methyltransferase
VDVLLSDMAPNLSGVDVIDAAARRCTWQSWRLNSQARVLKPQGCALIKVFQGAGFEDLVRGARVQFGDG